MRMYKEEDDSYLKDKRRKDEDESKHPLMKKVAAKSKNPKKKAIQSMLGSVGSGANFRN